MAYKLTKTIETDDLDLYFEATAEPTDFGVPNSEFYEVEDVELIEVYIMGHRVDITKLPDSLVDTFYEYAEDLGFEDWDSF